MTTATESFLTQLDKAAEGKSINLIEFEGLLDTIAEKPIEEEVVEEENYAIPEYPMKLDPEDDDGDWVVGDTTKPIEGFGVDTDTKKVIDKANKDVEKDRAVKSLDDNGMKMESAMSELSAMFEDMTGLDLSEPEPEIVAERCSQAVEEGYGWIKLHETEDREVAAARQTVGEDFPIMLDTNCPWTEAEAHKRAEALRQFRLHWLEEPIFPPENFKALATLQEKFGIPIEIGRAHV